MKRVLFDLEGNGLLNEITKVHCIACCDLETRNKSVWGPDEIPEALKYLSTADQLIAHNGLGYDFPVLEKLHGFTVPFDKRLDTLVLARLIFPDVRNTDSDINDRLLSQGRPGLGANYGKHTLRAWGQRLGVSKGDFEGPWEQWSQAMQDYCVQDIDTTLALWEHLKPDEFSQDAIKLEHRVALVCNKITEAGWPFDMQKAGKLHADLVTRKHELEAKLSAEFGGWVDEETFIPKVNNKARGYVKGVPFIKKTPVAFNPDSRQHIARALKERGWTPTEFTESGQPKLDDEVIENIAIEFPSAGDIGEYLMVSKRLGQLADGKQALLKNVGEDLRIHGSYNPMGAVTSRASHFNPNLAQVPNSSSQWGKEFRECFTVPEGWEMVGADMEGLEIRALCHYLWKHDDGAFATLALEGDIHWSNVRAMGLVDDHADRDKHSQLHTICRETGAKRFFYAWLYGAGNEKAGRILLDVCRLAAPTNPELLERFFGSKVPGVNRLKEAGKALKDRFLAKIPVLRALLNQVGSVAEKHQAVPGLDKRRIPIRSKHAALNTLLQSAGAILCKRWLCDFYDLAAARGYEWRRDFIILGWIHDEIQVACRNGLTDEFGRMLTTAARGAGDPFGFRVRLDSSYKLGRTWADTH